MEFSFNAVRHGESAHLEFKREFPAKKENFLKTVSAFSNTSGGFIVFGIDDKTKEIVGIPEGNQFLLMDQIANCISDSITPQVSPEITLRSHKQKTVVVVQIFPGAAFLIT
ncbi:MAG: ATP-binding protein [Treponema sp.]|nr:ATP-binding protein [Treponema sp.]